MKWKISHRYCFILKDLLENGSRRFPELGRSERQKNNDRLFSGMKEMTTKVLGDQPDLLVDSGCRSKINAGTDDEMTITGYKLVR